ncbi:MAG: hypothetical protein JSW67_03550 [Candidatus Latescibacterota bacterium]|nr:MAG: hypothetical protein JSW67_03550 [Candidatus Latescibacterota bacterium]
MARRPRSRFDRARRRQALTTWSFLRPQEPDEDRERLHERLRGMPELRREYRHSLALQLGIVGALLLSCVVLLVQSFLMLRSFEKIPSLAGLAWVVPALVAALGYLALRRFLRVLGEYRRLKGD